MTGVRWLATALLLVLAETTASAGLFGHTSLEHINAQLHGQVVDYTKNHGGDHRIWSPALHQRRDMYVYLPPGFDPAHQYPVMLWLHGIAVDEQSFLKDVLLLFDAAIADGRLPPFIIAAPDGSIKGHPSLFNAGSFYINSRAGNFEDYIIQDVWSFLVQNYPIRPEREAHILAGVSMGGFGVYNLGIKHRDCFAIIIGIFPPLNLRWMDCHGHYFAKFDPCCWGWRPKLNPNEVIGRFYCGLVQVRMKSITDATIGRVPNGIEAVSQENPIEMLDTYHVQPGELAMYIGYGGKDEYNIDTQIDSFLYRAREKGLCVCWEFDPNGKHDSATGIKLFPGVARWLAPQLRPYCPVPGTPP